MTRYRAFRRLSGHLARMALALGVVAGCGGEKSPPPAAPSPRAAAAAGRESALLARLERNPGDHAARLALANLYYDSGRPHRAAPLYLEALKHRDDPAIRTDLATCYKRMGLLDRAKAEYKRVLDKYPGHLQATYNLAVVAKLAGDPERAAELWERAAKLAPGTPIARAALRHAAEARAAARKSPQTPSQATTGKDPER